MRHWLRWLRGRRDEGGTADVVPEATEVRFMVPVPGVNLNLDRSPWHDPADAADNGGCPFPHCDSQVLHRPGSCRACDGYPRSQASRLWMRVAFTDDPVPHPLGFVRCPSLDRRSRERIERWPGNRPC